jgi:hypothetical protein
VRRSRTAATASLWLAVCVWGCGSSSTAAPPTAPTHTPAPVAPPTGPVAPIAGTWAGTIESSNFGPKSITLLVVQSTNCIDGAWRSDDGQWLGAISGVTEGDIYIGQISLVPADDRERCEGIANVDGPVGSTSLRWTGAGFEVRGTCQRALPRNLVISLRRQ